MKAKQKLITAAITVIIGITSAAPASFAKTTLDDKLFDLQTLGIMTGDENGDLQLDKPVTRAEFAAMTVRMMSMQNVSESYQNTSKFTDVSDDYWAKNSINFLSDMNVINGTSPDTFSPEDNIDVNAASKILVCALGYDYPAKENGGYPSGYLYQAGTLGILDGVDTSVNPITREEVAKMIFNALDVDIMTMTMSGGFPNYKVAKGSTFRKQFTNNDDSVLTKLTGTVTATANAYLDNPVPGIDDTRIQINGAIYQISDPSYAEYFGQNVDFFVDGEDSNIILSMKPSSLTTVQTITPRDIQETTSSRVTYLDNGTRKTIRFDSNGYFVYNNRITYDWDADTLMNQKNGTVTFIDNDNDGVADVIISKEYTSVIVNNIALETSTVYLKENQLVCGNRYIKLDDPSSDIRVTLSDKNGNPLTAEDLNDEDVLTCYISEDESIIEIIANNAIVSGKITTIGENYITVNDDKYYFENEDYPLDVKSGIEYDIYLNFNNEAVYAKAATASSNYAYISKIYPSEDGESYSARLILPNTIQEKKEEEKDDDGGAAKVVSKLACQNKEIINLPLSSKVSVNGTRTTPAGSSELLTNQVMMYETNSKGEISKFTTPTRVGTGIQKYYNSSERTFGKTTGGAFGVDMDTLTICIPKDDPNASKEDWLTAVEMNNGQLYEVKAYDQDEDTHMANLIVVTMTMKAGTTGLINTKSKVAMVQDCSYSMDEDLGEPYYLLELLTAEGTTVSYKITNAAANSEGFEIPSTGQLISYSLDLEYNVDAVKILGALDSNLAYGRTNPRLDYETFFGYINNIEYNQVSENLNRWVHLITCSAPSGEKDLMVEYEVLKNSGPPIFICDHRTKKSTFGTIDDIDIANDEIFVSAANNSVRAVVILR